MGVLRCCVVLCCRHRLTDSSAVNHGRVYTDGVTVDDRSGTSPGHSDLDRVGCADCDDAKVAGKGEGRKTPSHYFKLFCISDYTQ